MSTLASVELDSVDFFANLYFDFGFAFLWRIIYFLQICSVDTVEGESQVMVLRASKRYLYDLKIVLSWTVSFLDLFNSNGPLNGPVNPDLLNSLKTEVVYTGQLEFSDVSSAAASREFEGGVTPMKSPNSIVDGVEWLTDARIRYEKAVNENHKPCKCDS